MRKWFWTFVMCFQGALVFSQKDSVVLRVNGEEVNRSEFVRDYRLHAGSLSPKEYADAFVLRRLQVAAALAEGVDTTAVFLEQHRRHRNELMRACLMEGPETDSCKRALYVGDMAQRHAARVKLAQVFRRLPQTVTVTRLRKETKLADSLYQAMLSRSDVDFDYWVERYSDDKAVWWAEPHRLTPEFEETILSLKEGEVSKPFFSPEGLHILKLLEREEPWTYDSWSGEFAKRLERRMMTGRGDVVTERLKKELNYAPNRIGIEELLRSGSTEKALFTIGGQEYTGAMFSLFSSSCPFAVGRQLELFTVKSLLDYVDTYMEDVFPETARMLREHDEDYLATEAKRRNVEIPATNDRAAWVAYFEVHRSDYRWDTPRYKGAVLHCVSRKVARKVKRLLKKTRIEEWQDVIDKAFNCGGKETVRMECGMFAIGDNEYIDDRIFKVEKAEPMPLYPFTVTVGWIRKGPEDCREVEECVKRDYRDYLDSRWKRKLLDSSKVEINQEVLKTVNNNSPN